MAEDVIEVLRRAVAAHQGGRLAEAEAGYRAVLKRQATQVDALNLLGVLLSDRGETAAAVALFDRALSAAPRFAAASFNKANALAGSGDTAGAEAAYRTALKLKPDDAAAWVNLGALLHRAGRFEEAIAALREATRLSPQDPRGHFNLGRCFIDDKRPAEAVAPLQAALAMAPDDFNTHLALGDAYADLGDTDAARRHLTTAINLNPKSAASLNRKAHVLAACGEVQDALSDYARAVALEPPSAANQQAFQIAIGNAHRRSHNIEDAMTAYESALRLDSRGPEALHNIGELLSDEGWIASAGVLASAAAALQPGDGRFAYNVGLFDMTLGRLAAGWDLFEHRFFEEGVGERTFKKRYRVPPPYWGGEDLRGRRLVVWREQGLGDEILGVGMLPDVLGRAAECVLVCNPRLRRIHERSFPGARVLNFGELADFGSLGCDYQTPLGSLGRFLRRDFGSFPRHTGYLTADPEKVDRFRRKYAALAQGRRVVGVSWRSQREQLGPAKSATLSDWGDVLEVPGVWWVNLQYGDCTAELAAVKAKLGVEVYQDAEVDPMGDLDDFFAQVAALDLLVSTSNTAVHVAGSLNVPAWVLLPRGVGSMWYWFLDRSDSPWYPSVRLFREIEERVAARPWWRTVTAQVGAELKSWAGHG